MSALQVGNEKTKNEHFDPARWTLAKASFPDLLKILYLWASERHHFACQSIKHFAGQIRGGDWASGGIPHQTRLRLRGHMLSEPIHPVILSKPVSDRGHVSVASICLISALRGRSYWTWPLASPATISL